MNHSNKTILLVGGGTGGHIIPIINLYKELEKNPKLRIYIIGGKSAIDKKLYSGLKNFIPLFTGKMHRVFNWNNIAQFFYLIWGLGQSLSILLKTKPDVIFSKAGYISLPIIFWAKRLGIPYFIHESDIEMGASNRYAAVGATKIFSGFPVNSYPKVFRTKMIFVGQILRPEIFNKENELFDFGFENKKPTVFITGGSQGSRNINNAIFNALDRLLNNYNLIHHVGGLDYPKAIEIRAKLDGNKKKSYFISDLLTKNANGCDMLLSAIIQSDLVVSRSSATTLAEVAALKKPIITVPYRYAAADHQSKNALFLKKEKAAAVISDRELNGEIIVNKIDNILSDPKEIKEMTENAYKIFPLDGLEQTTFEIETFLGIR